MTTKTVKIESTNSVFLTLAGKCISDKGFTFNCLTDHYPDKGYAVANINESATFANFKDMTAIDIAGHIAKFVKSHPHIYFQKNGDTNLLGAWVYNDTLYLETCKIYRWSIPAKSAGRANNQHSIYDLKNRVTIEL